MIHHSTAVAVILHEVGRGRSEAAFFVVTVSVMVVNDGSRRWGFTQQRGWGPVDTGERAMESLRGKLTELVADEDPYVRARELCGLTMEARGTGHVGRILSQQHALWCFLTDAIDEPESSALSQGWALDRLRPAARASLAALASVEAWEEFSDRWSVKALLRELEAALRVS